MGGDGSTVLLYQPQVESWKDYKLLRARMAVAFRRMGTDSPTLGGVLLEGDTSTSSEAGHVRISNIRIVEGRFPGLSAPDSARLLDALRARMSKEDVIVETERITAYLERAETAFTPAALKSDPPKIFVSTSPAVLVNIDGPPVLAPIPGTELSYVVNTNWDLLRAGTTYYLRHEQGWLTAPAPAGPWTAGDDHSHELRADPGERPELGRRAEGGAGRGPDAGGGAEGLRERDAGGADPAGRGAEAGPDQGHQALLGHQHPERPVPRRRPTSATTISWPGAGSAPRSSTAPGSSRRPSSRTTSRRSRPTIRPLTSSPSCRARRRRKRR